MHSLEIRSPKRSSRLQNGWEGFFPYYAGFPEHFARAVIDSARLNAGNLICDPWNGSGTTTYVASLCGVPSIGFDLNPVMMVVAKARLLPPSEADSIEPLGREILHQASLDDLDPERDDPLLTWFGPKTSSFLRSIERSIRRHLVGESLAPTQTAKLDKMSGLAATNYVALFSVCRDLSLKFRSTNPTWLRQPRQSEERAGLANEIVAERFQAKLRDMAAALSARSDLLVREQAPSEIRFADSTKLIFKRDSIDLFLTSPPYCTRIDYTAATRVELALLAPITSISYSDLGSSMIGSTRVPAAEVGVMAEWGAACAAFLKKVRKHPSKASSGYYYLTHLDYFDKMSRSISALSQGLAPRGAAVLVVQDSYYKDVHNDLPKIIAQMAELRGLILRRREDFVIPRTMANMNPRVRAYRRDNRGATEAVLCFTK